MRVIISITQIVRVNYFFILTPINELITKNHARGDNVIESSLDNIELALSIICAAKNYKFRISAHNIPPLTAKMIEAHVSELIIINEKIQSVVI